MSYRKTIRMTQFQITNWKICFRFMFNKSDVMNVEKIAQNKSFLEKRIYNWYNGIYVSVLLFNYIINSFNKLLLMRRKMWEMNIKHDIEPKKKKKKSPK